MKKVNNHKRYLDLRKQFPVFTFQSYSFQLQNQTLEIEFVFNISDEFIFRPSIKIPSRPFYHFDKLTESTLSMLVFHIGMVELISYWKSCCPPLLNIKAHSLDKVQADWWKKLYFEGLGEFFYLNSIETDIEQFVEIVSEGPPIQSLEIDFSEESVIVPVGGGKDSIVTLELLIKDGRNIIPMMLNPREANTRTIEIAGFDLEDCIIVNRQLDGRLIELNDRGFLNGHTPFSALLAFVTLLAGAACKTPYIALSNESSANESTVPGLNVNHQYSKSIEFESDFNHYVSSFLHPSIRYFSFLRPVNELQIGKLFSGFDNHFNSFRSCNVGSKTDSWCGTCPKCLFTFIILSPFIEPKRLVKIFDKDLYADTGLIPLLNELTGLASTKPFECVGTPDEVKAALWKASAFYRPDQMPELLAYFKINFPTSRQGEFSSLLIQFDLEHFIPERFVPALEDALANTNEAGFVDYLSKRILGKSVLILGFGIEGQSSLRFLRKHFPDIPIGIADVNSKHKEAEMLLGWPESSLHFGHNYLSAIKAYDLIIKSPGVHIEPDSLIDGIEITSQSDLFLSFFRKRVIGVTGTKGKSTTSTLIYHLLGAGGRHAILIGNIGVPAFDMVCEIDENTVIVYELSAHQLEAVSVSPHIAVLLNIFPEHLDYFKTVEKYRHAKQNIFRYQRNGDFLIIHESLRNYVSSQTSQIEIVGESKALNAWFSEGSIHLKQPPFHVNVKDLHLRLIGKHNLYNILTAMLAVSKFGIQPGESAKNLESFNPLPHRLEYVGEFHKIHFYNDSISTVPESAIAAIDALDHVDTLILGGFDRRLDYSLLIKKITVSQIRNFIFLGKAGDAMMKLLSTETLTNKQLFKVLDIEEAIAIAIRQTAAGSLCLLSPAAASYDQFHNFEHRGDTYKKLIKKLM